MATAAEKIEESETSVRLRAQMSASPGVELLWDLIAVGGFELKDPLFRKGSTSNSSSRMRWTTFSVSPLSIGIIRANVGILQ